MLAQMRYDDNVEVRRAVASALAKAAYISEAKSALELMANDADPEVRKIVKKAIGKTEDQLAPMR